MLSVLAQVLSALYSFPWFRIPDIAGIALPFQRLLGWLGLLAVVLTVLVKGYAVMNTAARWFVGITLTFSLVMLISSVISYTYEPTFNPLMFVTEFSKYVAVFASAFFIYAALEFKFVSSGRLIKLITLSGAVAIVIAYALLVLFWLGFRSQNEILAPAFGSSLGVWPTSSFLPRLAGTTAEPQQFSVAFITALMLMLNRRNIRRYGWLAGLGMVALLLSQSKFAFISLAAVLIYVDVIYKKHRLVFGALGLMMLPVIAYVVSTLPVIQMTFEQGLEARAFTERLQNLEVLLAAIKTHFFVGIGVGQYGTFWSQFLYNDPTYWPGYSPGNDLMTLFAENGVFGFALIVLLLSILMSKFMSVIPRLSRDAKEQYLPFIIGAIVIILNMFIGYEFLHVFFWINIGMLLYLHKHPQELNA